MWPRWCQAAWGTKEPGEPPRSSRGGMGRDTPPLFPPLSLSPPPSLNETGERGSRVYPEFACGRNRGKGRIPSRAWKRNWPLVMQNRKRRAICGHQQPELPHLLQQQACLFLKSVSPAGVPRLGRATGGVRVDPAHTFPLHIFLGWGREKGQVFSPSPPRQSCQTRQSNSAVEGAGVAGTSPHVTWVTDRDMGKSGRGPGKGGAGA